MSSCSPAKTKKQSRERFDFLPQCAVMDEGAGLRWLSFPLGLLFLGGPPPPLSLFPSTVVFEFVGPENVLLGRQNWAGPVGRVGARFPRFLFQKCYPFTPLALPPFFFCLGGPPFWP